MTVGRDERSAATLGANTTMMLSGTRFLAALVVGTTALLGGEPGAPAAVQPFPRAQLPASPVFTWNLADVARCVPVGNNCTLTFARDKLHVQSTGDDPFVELPEPSSGLSGPLSLHLQARFATGGAGRVYWRTERSPSWSEAQSQSFAIAHDQRWHDYEVPLSLDGPLVQLRLDPGEAAGAADIRLLELAPLRFHPLEVVSLASVAGRVRLDVHNHHAADLDVSWRGQTRTLPAAATSELAFVIPGEKPFEWLSVELMSANLPPLVRQVAVIRPETHADWKTLNMGPLVARFAADGSGARIERAGQVIGFITPLVSRADVTTLELRRADEDGMEFTGEGVRVRIERGNEELAFHIDSEQPCEGPVVRPLGDLEQGLFAGLEYLGRGEYSSSTLDIETDEHLRFAPDPMKVTMPLAVCRTPSATWSLVWNDMNLQPWYAVPNFIDGAPGHRMSLHGRTIRATVRIAEESLEEAIERASFGQGLPDLPEAPRTPDAQRALCLAALEGPLRGPGGWGHCAEPDWGRAPYADMASTIFYLSRRVPPLNNLVGDGSHLRNDVAWLLSGRAKQWRDLRRAEAEAIRASQRADGSFGYDGPLARGHFENTASGYEAERAARLLDWAWYSGDRAALEAGLKSLDRLRRFRTPRGAQTWEVPLHTPDIMASAWLVRAYVRGYALTARDDLLREAVKWAMTGVPFVYHWQARPTMAYATIAVLGATQWRAPNWIGLPVQWCGIVYADAIAQLAEHDDRHDWRHLADGILRSAELMQYPDGPFAGCLPDSFELAAQERRGPAINPCALVYLRRRLDGEPVGLCVAANARHRIVAPFAVTIDGERATIHASAGISYQVLIDGERIVDVTSRGVDVLPLGE